MVPPTRVELGLTVRIAAEKEEIGRDQSGQVSVGTTGFGFDGGLHSS